MYEEEKHGIKMSTNAFTKTNNLQS